MDQRTWPHPKSFKTTLKDIQDGKTTRFGPINSPHGNNSNSPIGPSTQSTAAVARPVVRLPPAPGMELAVQLEHLAIRAPPLPHLRGWDSHAARIPDDPPGEAQILTNLSYPHMRDTLANVEGRAPKGQGRYSAVPPPPVENYDRVYTLAEQEEADNIEAEDSPNGTWNCYPAYRQYCRNVGIEWPSRAQIREAWRQEWDAIMESLANESGDENSPNGNDSYSNPWAMAQLENTGWSSGEGLGRNGNGISEPLGMPEGLSWAGARPTGVEPRPSPFFANWATPDDPAWMYTCLEGSLANSYPFRVDNTTIRAWNLVMRNAMARDQSKGRRPPQSGAPAVEDEGSDEDEDEDGNEDEVTFPPRNSANATNINVAAGWDNPLAFVQAADRQREEAAIRENEGVEHRLPVFRETFRQVDADSGTRSIVGVTKSTANSA